MDLKYAEKDNPGGTNEEPRRRGKFSLVVMVIHIVFLVLFGIFVEYSPEGNPKDVGNNLDEDKGGRSQDAPTLHHYYSMFQDVHIMIFVGFGFLMTFMKKYSFGSVGFNMLAATISIEWATLMGGFLHMHHGKIQISALNLLTADFAAAAVLISFGAVLGRLSPLQLVIMALCEIPLFQINEWIGFSILQVTDVGESMFVHVFGAYFGLAVSRAMYKKDIRKYEDKQSSCYHSDLFSMIGTIFLWAFWPSFNSAVAEGDEQHRAVINTFYSLVACCITTFVMSAIINKEDKMDMVHIQNATLAGGVAVGAAANLFIQPWGALLIGSLAAILSVLGFTYLSPYLSRKLKLQDQCGVHNLHGMPGVMAGIVAAIVSGLATEEQYGYSLYQIWPARAPMANSTKLEMIQQNFTIEAGRGRSALSQAGRQIGALGITLSLAVIGGFFTGWLLRCPIWNEPEKEELYDDTTFWHVPEDQFPEGIKHRKISGATWNGTDRGPSDDEVTKI